MDDTVIWGIHAGQTGDADELFLSRSCIAVGWHEAGDVTHLPANRESFKERFSEVFTSNPKAIPTWAGQLFRFVHEMKIGDIVAYSSKQDRTIHIGRVSGPAVYDPAVHPRYTTQRPVEWLRALPRTTFSQGALYEIGSALTLFQIRNYAEEYLSGLRGNPPVTEPVVEDEAVAYVADEIESTTQDFVLRRLAQDLKGHPFAHFVAQLLGTMGYRTRVAGEGPDGGIDIIAHRDELGFEPPIVKVQVKSTEGRIGDPEVSALYGKVEAGEYGLLVTLGTFTPQARAFARAKSNLRLLDGVELVDLILSHYEMLDSRYKRTLPLRRVYIPESLTDIDN